MHGTTASIRTAGRFPGSQVAAAEIDPAWRTWVRLLDIALEAADDNDWAEAVPEPLPTTSSAALSAASPSAPLLHQAVIHIDATRVRRLLRTLLRQADIQVAPRPRRLDALGVLRAAITHDAKALEQKAEDAGVDARPLGAVAQLATIPLLRACAVRLRDLIPETWLQGYCPVCGAWPTLVEIRGLERNRRLRCGRCSSDWPIPVLRCPFCSEIHHDQLHALLPEGAEQTRRVDVCDSCRGYIKGFATLQAMPLRSLATADLATVELDLVAQARGYERPSNVAFPLSVTVLRTNAQSRTPSERPAP